MMVEWSGDNEDNNDYRGPIKMMIILMAIIVVECPSISEFILWGGNLIYII